MTILVLTPRTPLAPSTRYQVKVAGSYFNPQPTSFTTGELADTTAPDSPMGKLVKVCSSRSPGSSCGEYARSLQFEVPTDDTPMAVLTGGDEPPPPALDRLPSSWPPDGPRPLLSDRWSQLTPPKLSLGQGACSHWPLDQPRGNIFFGAIDLSGNFSGWRAGGPVVLPDYPTVPVPAYESSCVESIHGQHGRWTAAVRRRTTAARVQPADGRFRTTARRQQRGHVGRFRVRDRRAWGSRIRVAGVAAGGAGTDPLEGRGSNRGPSGHWHIPWTHICGDRQVKSVSPSISGPLQASAPLLAHWQGQATREHKRPPLQVGLQQVQCPLPHSESRVQRCPMSVRQRPWKQALLHEPGWGVPSARKPAHAPPGGAYRHGHERPQ